MLATSQSKEQVIKFDVTLNKNRFKIELGYKEDDNSSFIWYFKILWLSLYLNDNSWMIWVDELVAH